MTSMLSKLKFAAFSLVFLVSTVYASVNQVQYNLGEEFVSQQVGLRYELLKDGRYFVLKVISDKKEEVNIALMKGEETINASGIGEVELKVKEKGVYVLVAYSASSEKLVERIEIK